MDHHDSKQHLSDSMPVAAVPKRGEAALPSTGQQCTDPLSEQPSFHTPEGASDSDDPELGASSDHKLLSQDAALDDAFPSIRKITPVGSPEDEDAAHLQAAQQSHAHAGGQRQVSRVPLLFAEQAYKLCALVCSIHTSSSLPDNHISLLSLQHSAASGPRMLPGSEATQHGEEPTTVHPPPDLHHTSAARLSRLNTVSRTAGEDPTAADSLHNSHISGLQSHRRSDSQSANSALSQLLQSDTQPSTGTPMARDLTEALTALASNKRLLSSMQASRSFSSPDLLSLAQQLHDSGQWPAVQNMVQQEEADEQYFAETGSHASSAHLNYGTVVGRPYMECADDQGRLLALCIRQSAM